MNKAGNIFIPQRILEKTVEGLKSFHPSPYKQHEGMVYWAGIADKDVVVTTCIIPKAISGPQEVHTTPEANAEVVRIVNKLGVVLVAQVHSHPENLKRHSLGDDKYAFMPYEGYFSIVVPYYAMHGMTPISNCGFHVFYNGKFEFLNDVWVNNNVKIIKDFYNLRR